MAAAGTFNMTEGKPLRQILTFSIPIIIGSLFQQLYNMVDAVIVGRFLGVNQLAAVGSVGSLHFLILGFCFGACAGMAIPVAQRFGAGDEENLRRYVANSAWLGAAIAAVLTTVTLLLAKNILRWMHTPDVIFDYAYSYFFVMMAGIPATILYNIPANVLRAVGDSRRPLRFLIISSLINVVLDVVLITVIPLGTTGAALATLISQLVSGILCLRYMHRKLPLLRIRREEWSVSKSHIRDLCGIGFPMGLQFSITAIGTLLLSRAVNDIGERAVAAMTAGGKISMLFQSPMDSMGSAIATYSGQNVGAKKPDRIRAGGRSTALVLAAFSIVSYLILYFCGRTMATAFVSSSETEVLDHVALYLRINGAFLPFLIFVDVCRNTIQGMGYSKVAVIGGILEMIARSLVAKLLVPVFGFAGASFAHGLAWVAADCFLIPCYYLMIRRLKHAIAK